MRRDGGYRLERAFKAVVDIAKMDAVKECEERDKVRLRDAVAKLMSEETP